MQSEAQVRASVREALVDLADAPLRDASICLFRALGYASRKSLQLDGSSEGFLDAIPDGRILLAKKSAETSRWRRVEFLFQLTNDEIPSLAQGQLDIALGAPDYRRSTIDSFVFLAIELEGQEWTRTELAAITREINRLFPMPVVVLFRHARRVSLAVIDRRPSKRDGARDVIERRISIIKDIDCANPHRAQVDTLADIALLQVRSRGRGAPTNFRDLYESWIEALSAQALNKKFYQELANWFFWSVKEVSFPAAVRAAERTGDKRKAEEARSTQNQIAVIRLLTRLIFVWFIKEKDLVPEAFFAPAELRDLLIEDPVAHGESSAYYKAILQNLFFATLNTEMSTDRKWRTKASGGGLNGQYLIHSAYRFRDAFRDPDQALAMFQQVPFLNGGLFECLDREVGDRDLERNPDLRDLAASEGSHRVIRIDGFSERPDNSLSVPNKIFFGQKEVVDLNEEYGTKGKAYSADGLIEIFSRYKFTVEENTPVEEEVALDPELLGKVFENLLASYNEDTRTTARKRSGSFYTPREVVDYMVDEALIAYFEGRKPVERADEARRRATTQGLDFGRLEGELYLPTAAAQPNSSGADNDADRRLRELLSYKNTGNPLSEAETETIISAIDGLKALDPACGSGAFLMGLLQKLIHVLHQLDPDNARWKAQNRRPLEDKLEAAKRTVDPSRKDAELEDSEAALAKLDHDFSNANKPDYARKLYLIDKCLFGVDIQPIAVQIAKLRFFISLVVSQKIDRQKDNANITALPNLETKLVAANSLIPIERPAEADLFRNPAIARKETELREMNERYFGARTMKTKRMRRGDIGRLRDELEELLRAERDLAEDDARKMAAWDPFDQNAAAPFFDPEWMFGLASKFDLVIGNPPYVRHEAISAQKPLLQKYYGGKDKNGRPRGAYSGTADLYIYFIQRGMLLLNPRGAFVFITSNKWYRAKYAEALREWLGRNARLRRIVDFGDAEVFDALAYPTIIVAVRRETPVQVPAATDSVRVMNWPSERPKSDVAGFPDLIDDIGFEVAQKDLTTAAWQLELRPTRQLLERIRAAGVPLKSFSNTRVFRGITTGFNEAFVISDVSRSRLMSDRSAAALLRPFLSGSDIDRWYTPPGNSWIIKIPSSDNETHAWSGKSEADAERIFERTYPSIANYVLAYKDQLKARFDKGRYYWELRSCRYWAEFELPKIVSTKISFRPAFSLDLSGSVLGNTAYFMPATEYSAYLVSILNSNIAEFYYRRTFATKQGGFYEVQPIGLENFPTPAISSERAAIFADIERGRFAIRDPRFEQLLNGLIYEVYFPEDLRSSGLAIFEEAELAGLSALRDLDGEALLDAGSRFAASALAPGARLRLMLSDLQTLDVVRIVEGKT